MTRAQLTAELVALKRELNEMNARIDRLVTELGKTDSSNGAKPTPQSAAAAQAFRGRPMDSKYSGQCAVCGRSYEPGTRIVYNSDARKAAHLGCGQPVVRGAA